MGRRAGTRATRPRDLSRVPGDQRVLGRPPPPARRRPSRARVREGTGEGPPGSRGARHAARPDPLPDERGRRRAPRELVPPSGGPGVGPGARARRERLGEQPGRRPRRGPRGRRRALRVRAAVPSGAYRNRPRPRSSACSGSSSTRRAARPIAADGRAGSPASRRAGPCPYVPKRRREEARRRFDGPTAWRRVASPSLGKQVSPVGAPDRHRRRIVRAGASGGGTGAG